MNFFTLPIVALMCLLLGEALAGPVCRQCFGRNFAQLESQYCNNEKYWCMYVNDNVQTQSFNKPSQGRTAHHPSDPITLYVLDNGVTGGIQATCAPGDRSIASFELNGDKESYIKLTHGLLNGYWKSNVGNKLQSGKITTDKAGDGAVLYCPVH